MLNDDLRYKLLKLLAEEPQISQRDLARRLSISVGKANYCLSALVEKGLVKINNFRKANNKLAYAYLLTPRGIEEKTQITVSFLQRKMREYGDLQREIEVLRREVMATGSGECYVNADASPQQLVIGDSR
ncbi:MarR family EPS-associated transcriptional regulator [Propionivibrio sp.]|uniref:MarR family EPS-associated transcriptional regulator n=1 Tax=Propionivibrio sp. TaxID=2212460 RepID=UPI0025FF91AE|nr:MarR family EPS-associated transcriptional regulator [Propionivibrio sp.]MBK7354721.1 MarR family EPS-associated transcriptional regulator [Propionivibrio sp.]MBK8402092.1 MarR family EPS-associated transcriptional regulator [Propionivibrio sp.]MBK8745778.1 MarR family EPS-associated transcriptional regulator [Propionivibrio sp.]MBK8893379.1 MarR family EPS-associated transcriptional regulator [Propionivibrio sp.]MBL0207562.1 MarR family EPS-associated transcriptional regulator [Propionivib